FLLTAPLGLAFFREHGWRTWDRVRTTQARAGDIVAGKMFACAVIGVVQIIAQLAVGWAVLDLRWPVAVVPLVMVGSTTLLVSLAAGLVLTIAISRFQTYVYLSQVLALLLAGAGGALIPIVLMPAGVRDLARAAPQYWAMRGFSAIFAGTGTASVGRAMSSAAVLALFAAGLCGLALVRFDPRKVKLGYG
ncbi:MAG: ABC transporter permease, partial [Acidimicrobiales bacterium]